MLPLVALTGLITLDYTSMPGGGSLELLVLGLALAMSTVIVFLARFAVALVRSDGRPGLRAHWIRWVAAPVMGVTVIGLVYADVPFTARFALSQPSLESFARQVAGGDAEHDDQWVGLFPVESVQRVDGGARFLVRGTGFLDRYGFAWIPDGVPEEEHHMDYTPVEGPWYVWEMRW
ncbi:hypothetical protein ACQEUU_29240 [Nonomuraea sp. CA-218870]|uniref:hypothetical protein n=1 Tax=Nonomuraea sp. CA-218870 TaxID=3239998 RepID=UPI003D8B5699